MKFKLTVFLLVIMIMGCAAETGMTTTMKDLQHHRWLLESINEQSVLEFFGQQGLAETSLEIQPDLDFGEAGHLTGNTGCNQFSSQASITDGELVLGPLIMTRRACSGIAGQLEQMLVSLYARNPLITRESSGLILTGDDYKLRFKLKDWVQ